MEIVKKDSVLWNYISDYQRGLILDGEALLSHAQHFEVPISDYSFLVFPFSKAYEGFLKQFFLDIKLIREDEYYSDEIRIGRLLNPNFLERDKSLYHKLCVTRQGSDYMSQQLWSMWKKGRNQVFHYFPHNFRKLTFEESLVIIRGIIGVMEEVVTSCELPVRSLY